MKFTLLEKLNSKAKGFYVKMEQETADNSDYRRVLFTSKNTQLVLMSLKPGEEIGSETHEDGSQFLRFETGEGKVIMGSDVVDVKGGDAVVIPEGLVHNVINTSESDDLRLYALYSPPEHKDGTVHETKEDE